MNDHVTIRMYNVGLGDCFLLTFPAPGRDRKVLIDCGVHSSGPGPRKIDEVASRIVEDVRENGKARIDVVIATHRHQDHVSGFESDVWDEVEVDEVWLPWTEDPTDPEAREIRETQSKKAKKIAAALRLMGASDTLIEMADNSMTNAVAMATLHHGFKGKPKRRFLPVKTRSRHSMHIAALPGVTIHTMGPSRDRNAIRDMNPPKGESYLRLAGRAGDPSGAGAPFPERWIVSKSGEEFPAWLDAQLAPPVKRSPVPGTLHATDSAFLHRWLSTLGMDSADFAKIDAVAREDALALVVALDAAVNGTSLMLMFEIGRAFLLFPGDAQWGTWNAAIADPEWNELLTKTTFYKVGHHGSHNSTPMSFVTSILPEEPHGLTAMVCTRPTTKFKEIPRLPLLKALSNKTAGRLARSDEQEAVEGFRREGDVFTEVEVDI